MRNRKIGGKVVIAVEEMEQLRELAITAYEAWRTELIRNVGILGPDWRRVVKGYFLCEHEKMTYVEQLRKASDLNPGVIAYPVINVTLSQYSAGPMFIATGEGPALNAEEWSEVLISKITLRDLRIADILDSGVHSYTKVAAMLSEETGLEFVKQDIVEAQSRLFGAGYRIKEQEVEGRESRVEEVIVGGDPASFERDPDAEDGLWAGRPCHAATLAALPEHSGEFGPRWMATYEGMEYGRKILGGGSTPAEVMRNVIEPCPYPGQTPARVWWIRGLLEVLKEAEAVGAREANLAAT